MGKEKGPKKGKVIVLTFFEKIAIRVQNEIEALLEDGYDVKVYNWNRGGSYQEIAENMDFEVGRINLNAPEKGIKSLFFVPILYFLLARKLLKEDFSILHCTHLAILPLSLLFSKKAKVVYDVREMHTIDFSEYFPNFLSKFARNTAESVENFMVSRVDFTLTIDSIENFLANRYRKYNENVEVLFNVPRLDDEPKNMQTEEIQREYVDKKLLVYVGGLTKRKGLMKAIEASKIVNDEKDIKLLIIGRLKDSEKEAKSFVKRNGLEDTVEFIDWLPFEEMFGYLMAADVGLALHQPSGIYKLVSKGNGRKFFTYMQASLPIVAPEFGEIGKIVREENCGFLVNTTKAEKIAEAIINLVENPDEAEEMGKRGRKAIEDNYNWEKEKGKLLCAYDSLESDSYE